MVFRKTDYKSLFFFSLFLFPIFPVNLIGFLGVFITISLLVFNYKNKINLTLKKELLVFLLPTIILVISIFYSSNLNSGYKLFGRYLLLFIIPIVFFQLPKKYFRLTKSLKTTFFFGVFILGIYFFVTAINLLIIKYNIINISIVEKVKLFFNTPYNVPFLWTTRDEGLLFEHKAYVSIALNICIVFIIDSLQKERLLKHRFLLFLLIIYTLYFIIYLKSTINIIFILLYLGAQFILVFKKLKAKIIAVLTLLIICSILTIKNHNSISIFIKEKFKTEARYYTWGCSMEVFLESPIIGFGIGDSQDKLKACYESLEDYKKIVKQVNRFNMNSHNQYLFFMISTGLLGLVIFVFSLLFFLNKSIIKKDWLFFSIILLFILNFSTENLLSRIYGIYVYSLIMSFLILRNKNLNN